MKPEQQRIAIAEACGYVKTETWRWNQAKTEREYYWKNPDRSRQDVSYLPNYLNDLNAMHEAEMTLTDKQHCIFYTRLITQFHHPREHRFCSATATQRAEAFLRTLNLWTE